MDHHYRNPHLQVSGRAMFQHLGIDTDYCHVREMFGDVKMVVLGSGKNYMQKIANLFIKELNIEMPYLQSLINIASGGDLYAIYKAGPVLCVSHGVGIASITVVLHEIIKLLDRAGCRKVVFLRMGTCAGIGVEPGTVVISKQCFNSNFQPYSTLNIVGTNVNRPAIFDKSLNEELLFFGSNFLTFQTVLGQTFCANDFYEEQGRTDGASCDFSYSERTDFLNKLVEENIVTMDMESLAFAAFCYHSNIKAAVICVVIINRLDGDNILTSKDGINLWDERPALIAAEYFRQKILTN